MIRFSRRDDTKDHDFYKERLSAYLDDELAPREQRAVEQHLKTCETCRWELATLKQTVAWLSELPVVPVPRVFTIPANVVPAPAVRRRQRSLVPTMQLATALAAVLLFFAAAGDVMLTGWPWATTAEPVMLQQAPAEQPAADTLAQAEVTLAVEAATITEPYGAAETAPGEPTVVAEAPEEAALTMQEAAPEASARTVAPTEPPAGMGGGEAEAAAEAEAAVAADAQPSVPPPAGTPGPLPMATPAPAAAAQQAPEAAFVPTPTALPTIHPPATAAAAEPPAALVQAPEAVPPQAVHEKAESGALTGSQTDLAVFWLRVIEYVLGVALVVLGGATVVLMVWRRRARTR